MIYTKIDTVNQFKDAFVKMDRDYYSLDAYVELFDYYDSLDTDYKLDVIAICCEWSEHEADDLIKTYGYMYTQDEFYTDHEDDYPNWSEDEIRQEYIKELVKILEDKTTVISLSNGGYLVQDF